MPTTKKNEICGLRITTNSGAIRTYTLKDDVAIWLKAELPSILGRKEYLFGESAGGQRFSISLKDVLSIEFVTIITNPLNFEDNYDDPLN